MASDEPVLELQQLYRETLVHVADAARDFVDDMPLDVLSGMYGRHLRQELERLTFWPVVYAATPALLVDEAVRPLFDVIEGPMLAHEVAFEQESLLGFMTDGAVRECGNRYARSLLQLSFRLTGVWSTSNHHFMQVRDAVQLLTFCEMMILSHGATTHGWFRDTVGSAELRRLRSYITVLVDLRDAMGEFPLPQAPITTVEWLRDNMHKPGKKALLRLPGVFETA